ncbi:uncharacterized protein WM277_002466 isoform 2-T2 [Molossus nigricans]
MRLSAALPSRVAHHIKQCNPLQLQLSPERQLARLETHSKKAEEQRPEPRLPASWSTLPLSLLRCSASALNWKCSPLDKLGLLFFPVLAKAMVTGSPGLLAALSFYERRLKSPGARSRGDEGTAAASSCSRPLPGSHLCDACNISNFRATDQQGWAASHPVLHPGLRALGQHPAAAAEIGLDPAHDGELTPASTPRSLALFTDADGHPSFPTRNVDPREGCELQEAGRVCPSLRACPWPRTRAPCTRTDRFCFRKPTLSNSDWTPAAPGRCPCRIAPHGNTEPRIRSGTFIPWVWRPRHQSRRSPRSASSSAFPTVC